MRSHVDRHIDILETAYVDSNMGQERYQHSEE